jgi:hypothetical protein
VDHRDVRSQETNLFHGERESHVLVDRVEDLLVPFLERRATFDVHAVGIPAGQPLFRNAFSDD